MMTHASLFSGIGGAEVAAAWMGWRNVFHCEIQEFPRKVLDYWFPKAESYEDITKTDFTKWHGKVDVLTGGFPCQPFSLAGRRKGEADNRYLWQEMHRAIREINPTWVIGENVAGITTMVESSKETYMGREADLFEAHVYIERKAGSRSNASAKTSKPQDTKSSRLLYQLVPSEHPTEETGSGLLPTVQTQGLKRCNEKGKTEFYPTSMLPTPTATDMGSGRTNKSPTPGAKERPTLAKAAKMMLLPTPNAVEATKYTHKLNPKSQMGRSLTALAVNGLMPTPSARDYKGNTITTTRRRKGQFTRWGEMLPDFITRLQEEQTGDSRASPQLNPLFVEEMMGFPLGWTTYPFLSEDGDSKA